ncbi:MAG TPA: type I methionyl aminopeptidase [bacterium]|nr:type I methionyl aminopeptidase [bacterium]HQA63786.1 type I methionyl aminopeptidase [bacterium]
MVKLKNKTEVALLRAGGALLAQIMAAVAERVRTAVRTDVSTAELNELAEKLIAQVGGEPSFKGYRAAWSEGVYPAALCVSLNNEVVHGLPSPDRLIKNGDLVGLDCGLKYRGYFTDMALTVPVGQVGQAELKLLSTTQEALMRGIEQIAPGKKISDIAKAIQKQAEKNNFSVVRQLVGHGVGYQAHEDPQVPNYWDKTFPDLELRPGLVLAIEPMFNLGAWPVEEQADGWTIVTKDNSISAHFEHTVAVTEKGYEILTMPL